MHILGISRSARFSPNSGAKDAAIFKSVADVLREEGHEVDEICEDDFTANSSMVPYIYNMARDERVLGLLRRMEQAGKVVVVNSAIGIEKCVRYPMSERFLKNGIPYPESWLIDLSVEPKYNKNSHAFTDERLCDVVYPCWLKRGDACAQIKEDIYFAQNAEELFAGIEDFRSRGIGYAVVNKHLAGDLVKFYGVAYTDFFYWYYPSPTGGKFGLEVINGASVGYSFDQQALKRCGDEAAHLLNVPVYGGDCVVAADGSFQLIDFNDWPSFSACCADAGRAIAQCLCKKFRKDY
jgi:hypothetical protein